MGKIKLQSASSTVFLAGGKAYQKGDYVIEYKDTELDANGVVVDGTKALVYLRPNGPRLDNSIVRQMTPWKTPRPYTDFLDSSGTAYASFDAFTQALAALVSSPANASTSDLISDKGVVTQGTSKTTAVVSNTLNTVITTVALTDAADTSFEFTFTNSKILTTSNIQITEVNSGTGVCKATITSIAGGSCVIRVNNTGVAAFNSLVKLHVLVS